MSRAARVSLLLAGVGGRCGGGRARRRGCLAATSLPALLGLGRSRWPSPVWPWLSLPAWGRLNHSCTQGADVSEMPAFSGRGRRGAGGPGQFCWVGAAPVRCLGWAGQPDAGAKKAWQAVASPRAHAGPPTPPPGGSQGRPGQRTARFSGLRGTSLLPACSPAPSGALAMVVVTFWAVALPRDAHGVTLMPLQGHGP